MSKKLDSLRWFLQSENIKYTDELRFHATRRWRFDLAIPSKKIAVEYEGVFSAKSRHTTKQGYTKDTEKYNAATILGWQVLRYTAANINEAITDVKSILNGSARS